MFYLLTLLVAASRFLPHPPNVACVGALGLFAGCYLTGRRGYLIPVAVLLLSDVIGHAFGIAGMGFYHPVTMLMVYAGAVASVPIGRWMRTQRSKLRYPAGSLAASTLFFLLSNFGVFLGGWYPFTLAGFAACYVSALPFFGYTIVGDLVFTALLFGAWQFSWKPVVVSRTSALGAPVQVLSR